MAKNFLSEDDAIEAERYFKDFQYQTYSEEDKKKVFDNEDQIMEKMKSSSLSKFLNDSKTFFRMLKAYFSGRYKHIPYGSLVTIIMTLLYVFSPLDLIPDFLPGLGLMDDATIMGACVTSLGGLIKAFKRWEEEENPKAISEAT